MFKFKDKTIIILSPQAWGKMHISKHHYAIELAKLGNTVYFFNPPLRKRFPKIRVESSKVYNKLFIVSYSYFFPYNLRFHLRTLFDILQKINIYFVQKRIRQTCDVLWCFDTNQFSDLKIFNCRTTIYHPVDNISGKFQKKLTESTDFIFSVSDVIIDDLQKINKKEKAVFINHGLSDFFVGTKKKLEYNPLKSIISAYFMGNVLLSSLDRDITKKIILENPNINFIFIGAYKQSNISGNPEKASLAFVSFLKKQQNVLLKGVMLPQNTAKEIQNADVLLILIDPLKDINKGSNSHKTLEYLSTGKVIVSNRLSIYDNKRELIEMVDENHNKELPFLFKKVINNLAYYNSPKLQQKRIEFALNNTYAKQIKRIEKIISENSNT